MSRDHWNQHAQQWQFVGPPLRPTREDVDLFVRLVDEGLPRARGLPPRAALLGVTPELATMPWPEGTRLAARLGWRAAEVRTIDAYRGADARYTFPTLAEAREILALHFVEEACCFAGYELGERCPTLRLRRRNDQTPLAASR